MLSDKLPLTFLMAAPAARIFYFFCAVASLATTR